MPLHPQVVDFLAQQKSLGLKSIDQCSPDEFRQMMRDGNVTVGEPEQVLSVEDRTIPGPAQEIPVRIYRPLEHSTHGALVYCHGGGWVGGDLDTHDALCRAMANVSQSTIVAVDYRLAPEHLYPAAADDAYAAFNWARENASALNAASDRIALGGDSAGGNLATVVCLMARDRHTTPPCLQVLVYPITNCDYSTNSYREYAEGYSLTDAGMRWFWQHYLPDEAAAAQAYASPLRAPDLSGLPPALVITAKYDVLQDEGKQYAVRLRDAGVTTESICYDDMFHGFLGRVHLFDRAREAVGKIADSLQRAFEC